MAYNHVLDVTKVVTICVLVSLNSVVVVLSVCGGTCTVVQHSCLIVGFLEQNALLSPVNDQQYLPYITYNPRKQPSAHAQPFNKHVVLWECVNATV